LNRNRAAPLPALQPALLAALLAALLTGCASKPTRPLERDGPPANPPAELMKLPDAVPRVEPLRVGGPNKPYEVAGVRYVPMTADLPFDETGGASWYGRKFHGQPTSSGETYDLYGMTAAHKTLPIPSYVRVRNPANGREVVVRVNDRGPFVAGRVIDLSYTAAAKLGLLAGVAPVQLHRLTFSEIRKLSGVAQRPLNRPDLPSDLQPNLQPEP
jgi:rare lipoprotein A